MGQTISDDCIKYETNLKEIIEKIYEKKDLKKYNDYIICCNFRLDNILDPIIFKKSTVHRGWKFKDLILLIKYYKEYKIHFCECRIEKLDFNYLYENRNNFINHKIYLI